MHVAYRYEPIFSKSIKKCMGMINTEFKIVFIPREEEGRGEGH